MGIVKSNDGVLRGNNISFNHEWSVGDGLAFDGVVDYVSLPTGIQPYNFAPEVEYSVAIAFSSENTTDNVSLFSVTNNTGDLRFIQLLLFPSFNQIVLFHRAGTLSPLKEARIVRGNYTQNSSIQQHCLLFQTGQNGNTYRDGVNSLNSFTTISGLDNYLTNCDDASIGRSLTPLIYSSAEIYYLFVFNKALTEQEILVIQNTNGQIIPNSASANIVAKYEFENKAGNTLTDKSTNALNGALNITNTTLEAGNAWVDKYGNSITQY